MSDLSEISEMSEPSRRITDRLPAAEPWAIARAADLLRSGGIVAFPTETVYGLGADAFNQTALARIFAAKDRPTWDPLIVHIGDLAQLDAVADLSDPLAASRARRLIAAFWPGPLTLLLPRQAAISDRVTAGRPLVGVRMPAHPVALALLVAAGVPIAAPSANRFGHISPTTAAHVLQDLDGRIDAVLDAGPTTVGLESTVLDVSVSPMLLLRPGAVTLGQIQAIAGPADLYTPPPDTPRPDTSSTTPKGLPSPGFGLRHYAPRARLLLVDDPEHAWPRTLRNLADDPATSLAVMLPDGWDPASAAHIYPWGPWDDPEILARRLYAGLRTLDDLGASTIVCPVPPAESFGAAIRDRLTKAARPK